jgi:PAS domain S-box-containing protein
MDTAVSGSTAGRVPRVESFLLDQVQAAVIAADLEGRVTHWNRHAEVLFGRSADEVLGSDIVAATVPAEQQEAARRILLEAKAGKPWEGEFEVWRKDGTRFFALVSLSPIHDGTGSVTGVVGVAVDISSRKRAEERLAARTGVTNALGAGSSLDEVTPRVLQAVCESLGWEVGALWTLDEPAQVLRCLNQWTARPAAVEEFLAVTRRTAFSAGMGLPGRVWATGIPAWIPDVSLDGNFPRAAAAAREQLHAAFGFPILLAGQVLGVIEFFSHEIREPDQELLQTMSVIGSQIGQFMERMGAEDSLRRSEARKSAILESALDCIITMDHRGNVVEFNPAAEQTFGYTREEAVGREMAGLIIPERFRDRHRRGLAHSMATGEGHILGQRLEMSGLRKDGSEFPVELSVVKVELPGRTPLFTGYLRDITGRKQAEEALRTSRDQLEAIFQGVDEGITVQDAFGRILYANEAAARLTGFPSVEALMRADVSEIMGRFEVLDASGASLQVDKLPGRVALAGETPPEVQLRFRNRASGEERWAVVRAAPVHDEHGRVRFAVNIFHDVTDRQREEEARRFLAEATEALARSLDYNETLRRVARLAVPRLADWCAISILEQDGTTSQLAVEHVDPDKVKWAKALGDRYPPDPNSPLGVPNVLRTGAPELYPEIPWDIIEAAALDEEQLRLIRELQLSSIMIVPLNARGKTLGAITLVSAESGRRFDEDDLAFAEELARRAALAVDNARLYQETSHIAEVLQRSLLPPALPEIPGIQLAARYRAAGEGIEVGGDFYDAFATGDGSWAVLIGDVCGKGPDAAAVTGLARHTLRAAAISEAKPSALLTALNEAVLRQRADQMFCTVTHIRLHPNEAGARATICCAGHPLPILLGADGSVRTIGRPGTLIGIFPDPELADDVVDLVPGDTVVLYTDGVIDEREEGQVFGRERLEGLLASCAGMDAESVALTIEDAVISFRSRPPRDDIAILVVKVGP